MPLPEIPYDEWFDPMKKYNPLDSMPIATDEGEWLPENGEEPPRPEEEIADMHEKAYRLARAKYNPFSLGGSESIHDFESRT
tara:strand:- start:172 stop:417 length:246 start_codon:yes stop_codon:yes gene_type:complete